LETGSGGVRPVGREAWEPSSRIDVMELNLAATERIWAPPPYSPPALERVATYLAHERELLQRFQRFRRAELQTPYGDVVPEPLTAVLRLEPGVSAGRKRPAGPVYRAFPVPGRPLDAGRILWPADQEAPRDGRIYRLERLRRRVVEARPPGNHRERVWEVLLEPGTVELVSPREFFPPPGRTPSQIRDLFAWLTEELGVSRTLTETFLLPFVGAPPWRGRPSGLDLVVGGWEIPERSLPLVLRPLRDFLPPWESTPARGDRRSPGSRASPRDLAPSLVPYTVRLESLRPDILKDLGRDRTTDISHLLCGNVEAGSLAGVLYEAHLPLLRPASHFAPLSEARASPELVAEVTDHLIRSHFQEPLAPEPVTVHGILEGLLPKVREALGSLLAAAELPARDFDRALGTFRGLREHFVQAALSRARLWNLREPDEAQFRHLADLYLDSLNALTHATRPSEIRSLITQASRLKSRSREERLHALRTVLLETPDVSFEELYDRLRSRQLFPDPPSLEAFLQPLESEGYLLSPRPGRYRWAWL
jgi:hypothetical protein